MNCKAISYRGKEPYLFFSFYSGDAPIVYPIIERLDLEGYRICFDDGSSPSRKDLLKRLLSSTACVTAISENASNSHDFREDITFALSAKNVFSILLMDFPMRPSLKIFLERTHYINAFDCTDEETVYKRFFEEKNFDVCRDANRRPTAQELSEWRERAREYILQSGTVEADYGDLSVFIKDWYGKDRLDQDKPKKPPVQEELVEPEKPPVQEKSAEPEKPSAQEKLIEPEKPPEQEKPIEPEKPPVREKPPAQEKPTAGRHIRVNPAGRKPAVQEKPVTRKEPATPKKPVVQEKNSASQEPPEGQHTVLTGLDDDVEKTDFNPQSDSGTGEPTFLSYPESNEEETYIPDDDGTTRLTDSGEKTAMNVSVIQAALVRIKTGEVYPLDRQENRIGRKAGQANVLIEGNSGISRAHAQIFQLRGKFKMIDLGSSFGSEVDGRRLKKDESVELSSPAMIRLADEDFLFLSGGDCVMAKDGGKLFLLRALKTGETRCLKEGVLPLNRNNPWRDGVLESREVSRIHAEVIREGNECRLRALKSTNGTYLNSRRMKENEECLLVSGDRIALSTVENFEFLEISIERS